MKQVSDTRRPIYRTDGTLHWLEFVDTGRSMGTDTTIDFSGTAAVSCFSGFTKLSDASFGVVYELSMNAGSTAGTFMMIAPYNMGQPQLYSAAKGNSGTNSFANSGYPAPATVVHTCLYDFAGVTSAEEVIPRINGIVAQSNPSGNFNNTGNFSNNPLFIGMRNNASSPFNGKLFGLVVVGRKAAAQEITDTESWMAAKTGVTLP